jgi:hypothetical protein
MAEQMPTLEPLVAGSTSPRCLLALPAPNFANIPVPTITTMDRVPNSAWLNADVVAASGLRALTAGRALDVPGVAYKGLAGFSAVLPRSAARRLMCLGAKSR